MAKYVGKIFKVPNKELKLHGRDIHHVHVQWYNPHNHMFKCRVITSLEEAVPLGALPKEPKKLICSTYDSQTGEHAVLTKTKYKQLRNGGIEPIPINQCENFKTWSGFSKTVYLSKSDLKLKNKSNMQIKKQR